MLCLTGDVHHMSLGTNDQRYLGGITEVQTAVEFLRRAERFDLKLTLYITGKAFSEELDDLQPLIDHPLVEIGGHTYEGLPTPTWTNWRYRLRGLTPPSHGTSHGSRRKQRRDILRTKRIIERHTGRAMVSWRSHGLVADDNTYDLLAEAGYQCISDEINDCKPTPEMLDSGLLSHPMNVIPDHDHLYHAHRDETFVRQARARGYGRDCFGDESYSASELGELIGRQVEAVESRQGIATVLLHPVCQYLADGFATAETLFEQFSRLQTAHARDLPELLDQENKP